ncbi:MAG: hypothetical protein JWM28_1244, partial [Chitinophagaceae bacterium]|nr:hypothetical protein [Chitinophagaceae bacterium]
MIFPQHFNIGISIRLGKGVPEAYRDFLLSADTWFSEDRHGVLIIQQR